MLTPNTIFGFILATLFGAVFHLIVGGDARRLALFLLTGWIGFGLGQLAGDLLGITAFSVGALRVLPAAFGALIGLLVALLLTANRRPTSFTR